MANIDTALMTCQRRAGSSHRPQGAGSQPPCTLEETGALTHPGSPPRPRATPAHVPQTGPAGSQGPTQDGGLRPPVSGSCPGVLLWVLLLDTPLIPAPVGSAAPQPPSARHAQDTAHQLPRFSPAGPGDGDYLLGMPVRRSPLGRAGTRGLCPRVVDRREGG